MPRVPVQVVGVAMLGTCALVLAAADPSGPSTREFRPFEVHGTEVNGATARADAPVLLAGEQYVDAVPATGTTTSYLLRRAEPGSVLTVGISGAMTPGGELLSSGSMLLKLEDSAGDTCGQGSVLRPAAPDSLLTGSVSTVNAASNPQDPCYSAEEVYLTITQDVGDVIAGKPIEIRISEEQPPADIEALPAPAPNPAWTPLTPSEEASTIEGAASFSDAPLLEPGSHSTTIMPGEALIYRVPLEWGQRLTAQADFATPAPELSAALGFLQVFRLEIIGPTLGDATAREGEAGEVTGASIARDEPTQVGVTMPEVRYRNREVAEINGTGYAGDYYVVAVLMSGDGDDADYAVPFTLTLDVEGQAGTGDPGISEAGADSGGAPTLAIGLAVAGMGFTFGGSVGLYRWWRTSRRFPARHV